jgi:hypothetical protein
MNQIVAAFIATMVGVTVLASTLDCSHANSQRPVRIVENNPQPGTATIFFAEGGSSILKFSQEISTRSTRTGPQIQISKKFFHPYYEYRIVGRYNKYRHVSEPLTYRGTFISEGNSNQLVNCKQVDVVL